MSSMEVNPCSGGDSATGTEQDAWEQIELEMGIHSFHGIDCYKAREKEEEIALVLKQKRQEKEAIKNEKKEYMRKKTEIVTKLCGKSDDDSELRAKIEGYNNKLNELEMAYLSKKNEVENAEKEWIKEKETVDRLEVERNTSFEKLNTLIGSFVTNKWVEITSMWGLTVLRIMKHRGKKLRFCIVTGIDKEYDEGVLQMAERIGIPEPSSGIIYELTEEGAFTKLSQEDSLALGFQIVEDGVHFPENPF